MCWHLSEKCNVRCNCQSLFFIIFHIHPHLVFDACREIKILYQQTKNMRYKRLLWVKRNNFQLDDSNIDRYTFYTPFYWQTYRFAARRQLYVDPIPHSLGHEYAPFWSRYKWYTDWLNPTYWRRYRDPNYDRPLWNSWRPWQYDTYWTVLWEGVKKYEKFQKEREDCNWFVQKRMHWFQNTGQKMDWANRIGTSWKGLVRCLPASRLVELNCFRLSPFNFSSLWSSSLLLLFLLNAKQYVTPLNEPL